MPYHDHMQLRRLAVAWLPAIAWMALIFYLSAQSRPLGKTPSPAFSYVAHFGEYAVLALLLFWAQLSRGAWKRRVRVSLAVSFVVSVLFAASDEYHQSFVSGRTASWLDFGTDALGAAFALAVTGRWGHSYLWRQVRYRRTSLPADPRHGRP
jgi:VanZ family protein